METGTVFWAFIAYSVIGWFSFRIAVSLIGRAAAARGGEIKMSGSRFVVLAIALICGAILSGPMTWGNVVRSFLVKRDMEEGV